MSWKRQLFLWHRWAGIVLCGLFALWFASGLFMMYVEFPQLTAVERLAGAQPLRWPAGALSPGDALQRLAPEDFTVRATPHAVERVEAPASVTPRSIRLTMIRGRPAYVVSPDNGAQPRVVFADDGEVLRQVTPEDARTEAEAFARRSGRLPTPMAGQAEAGIVTDQWTVSSALNADRPLVKVRFDDPADTVLYVSSSTGEVVRDTHATERWLNLFGAVTHWIYPVVLRQYPDLWEWVVDILSVAGVVLALTGIWIGWLRWNRRARPGKPQVPYRGLMRWHYFTGAIFGLFTLTWIFSGLLSMNPLGANPPRQPDAAQRLVYAGKPLTPSDFELPAASGFGAAAREAELVHYAGQPFFRVLDADLSVRLLPGNAAARQLPDATTMIAAAPQLMPGEPLRETRVLSTYDNYYYTRHPERGERPLPVVRVRFDDARQTWFHLDPVSGRILDRSTRTNRVYRWLYNGLHSFDIWWLWQRRPLWDLCVIAFSLGGLLLSVIGVVIGWRRLFPRRHPHRQPAPIVLRTVSPASRAPT